MTRRAPGPRPPCPTRPRRGLGAVAIIVVLVALSALAAAIVRLGMGAQASTARDLMGTRASLAARSGIEWGLYQAFKGSWTTCSGASQTLDLRSDHGLYVTVQCDSATYNEGESAPGVPRTVRVYTLDAVACPATSCPDASASAQPGYVERRRVVHAVN
ncbi:MSHA biogenesis protein MshP [Ideonella sp. A 288]|uniref:MSHA biogenesis protein MshP n=1 Tax=Ideonella sp. A 288 TaxID=1962181 RepID=UPI000B4BBB52|nr:MSHA biogenesis protein MshP [Ideonella sp. A 288]